jgi:Major Facilitator Superfamily
MLASEVGRGLAIAAVVGLLIAHHPIVPLIIGAAILEESLEVFATLAERRCVRAIVPSPDRSSALVRLEARTHVAVLTGRPVGGLLFEWWPICPFAADVVSFVFSISMLLRLKREPKLKPAKVPISRLFREVRDGLGELRRRRFGWMSVVMSAFMTLISQALIMVFLADAHNGHVSSLAIGIVLAASGLGGAIGAVAGQQLRLIGRHSRIKIQPYIWVLVLFGLAAVGESWLVPSMAVAMLVLGFTGAMANLELDNFLINKVPDEMQARVASVERLTSFGACALGPMLGGWLIAGNGSSSAALWTFVVMAGGCAVFAIRIPSVRKLDHEPARGGRDLAGLGTRPAESGPVDMTPAARTPLRASLTV